MPFVKRVNKKGYAYWQNDQTGEVTWDEPAASFDPGSPEPEPEEVPYTSGDWTLYNDEDGA